MADLFPWENIYANDRILGLTLHGDEMSIWVFFFFASKRKMDERPFIILWDEKCSANA